MTAPVVIDLSDADDAAVAGGKAVTLARLRRSGLPIPPGGVVVTTSAYRTFVVHKGLGERIALELTRRPLSDLRAEETWDVALRVRAMMLAAEWPEALRRELADALEPITETGLLAVRSSAPHEDATGASFAGLHESATGVDGLKPTLEAIRSVWASLFSNRALLYHAELGLDPAGSSMAVIIQPLIEAQRAGVAFTTTPGDDDTGLVEGVWGLGEGLVSGRVEPDTWTVRRADGRVIAHRAPQRAALLTLADGHVVERALTPRHASRPPLREDEVRRVWRIARDAEGITGGPVDVEWAIGPDGDIIVTQARPITTPPADARAAYIASQASADTLERLRRDIESRVLPKMHEEAVALASIDLHELDDTGLAREVRRRVDAVRRWRTEYRSTLIPMAHGARILGRVYVDTMRPTDPFEYLGLLVRTPVEYATHRQLLAELGIDVPPEPDAANRAELETRFLSGFTTGEQRDGAAALLELARASWRLRDDDNLYLSLIEREADRARTEVERRGRTPELAEALAELATLDAGNLSSNRPQGQREDSVRPRQLLGQPAGPGVGRGTARVIRDASDLRRLTKDDVVVADALEPETAAYAARAAGIVERRGGMLVHGAIVAREHGVPCVTGVPDATAVIRDGERLTVDGHLGIVVLEDV